MDRNQIIGIILIVILLIGYGIYQTPSKEEQAELKRKQDSIRNAFIEKERLDSVKRVQDSLANLERIKESNTFGPDSTGNDSLVIIDLQSKYGVFADAAGGEEKFITLENNLIKLKFTTKGAYPTYAELKEFKTHDQKPLILFDKNENSFALKFYSENKAISSDSLYFENINGDSVYIATETEKSVVLRVNAGQNKYVEYVYTLEPESYLVKFDMRFYGLEREMASNSSYIDLLWKQKSRKQEHGSKWENQNTTIYYKLQGGDVTYLTETKDEELESVDVNIKWIAYKDHFFSTVLIAQENFDEADLSYKKDQRQEKYLKYFESNIALPFDKSNDEKYSFVYYFGPNDYDILKKISLKEDDDLNIKRMIPLGWAIFRWVNQGIIIPLFNFLGSIFGNNMGLIILIMTILIKLALFPLTYRSYTSSAKMRVLKPQIDEINKKIPKEKAMERQQATMALYRKVGVNPMGGCLPILFQMPFLIAMFRFFPASIELRQKSFLWADDLSSYDAIVSWNGDWLLTNMFGNHISLFTILMAGAMLISTMLNRTQMQGTGTQMPGMKFMLYLMPVMMLLWFNNYASGLSYYYFLSNVITIIQTLVIRRMIDEKALLEKLNAQKKKTKKKSKWQQRIEEMQKIQEQQKKKRR